MFFGNCWESAFYLSLTSEKILSLQLLQVSNWKAREAVFKVFPHQIYILSLYSFFFPYILSHCSLHRHPCVRRNDLLGVCRPMPEQEQSCVLSWPSQMSLLDKDEEVKKKSSSPKRDKPRWPQNALGSTCNMGAFLLLSWRKKCCISPPSLAKLYTGELAATSWLMFLLSNTGLTAAQAKQVLLPEPNGCSHREEQKEEQSQETPESWISCSCSLSRPPPSAASAQAKQTAGPRTSCSPLWRQPPTWLVCRANLQHSRHCFRPIHRHFRGKSSLMFSGMFLWRLCFSAPLLSACFFEHIWFFF